MLSGLVARTYRISQEQYNDYHRNGYLIAEKLFSEKECDAILQTIKSHANKDFAAILNPDREDFLAKQAPFSSRENVRSASQFLRNVMKDVRIVSILETLQGKEVVGLMSQMLFKEAGSAYASQAWNPHQDNAYCRNLNGQYVTTNLFLADADRENGSLYIYPHSHQEGILEAKPTTSYRETIGQNPGNTVEVPPKYVKVDLRFRKGDLLLLHGNTIHGSYPNRSETRSRPLYSCSYLTQGEEFVSGENAQRRVIPLH